VSGLQTRLSLVPDSQMHVLLLNNYKTIFEYTHSISLNNEKNTLLYVSCLVTSFNDIRALLD